MKKEKILYFILGLLVASTTAYAAYKYQASEIDYTPSNSNFDVDNVEDAIDEIYDKMTNSFQNDSWETIIANVKSKKTSQYHVGDVKSIDLGTFGTHYVRIANKSTPSECSTSGFSQTACGFVIEFTDIITTHRMNATNTNVGGWPATEMRTYVNNDIYNALPSALKSGIINTTVVSSHGSTSGEENFTSTDKLYLLTPMETSGDTAEDSAASSTRLLDYYINKTNDDRIKYKSDGQAYYWWYRSASLSYGSSDGRFIASINGIRYWYGSNSSFGVSPAFRIG